MFKKLGRSLRLLPLAVALAGTPAQADELIIDFVAELLPAGWNGPTNVSPFEPGTQFNGGVTVNPDLLKGDVQFVVKGFDPNFTGTYSFGSESNPSDPGVEFLLHTPLLERVEAFTTRIGSNSPQGYGTDTKILLPRTANSTTTDEDGLTTTGFFGEATLSVLNGVPQSLSYTQGADNLASFDFLFTPNSLEELAISASVFTLTDTYDLDTPGAADAAPYGLNSTLNGNPGSTVLDATRGIIQAELDAPFAGGGVGNLLDGKEGSGGQPIATPLDGTGTLYRYTASDATIAVTVVPEPGTALLMMMGLAGLSAVRRDA